MNQTKNRGRQKRARISGLAGVILLSAATAHADAILPGECIFPEGVTATSDGALYVGSMQHGAIYRVAPDSTKGELFVEGNANGLVATLGVYADEANNRLIACSADPGIAHTKVGDDRFTGKAGSGIRTFDLETGASLDSVDFPGGGFCNDIAVDAKGAIYATDTFHGRILRYDGEALDVFAMGGVLADQPWTLNGIDYRAADNSLYVGNQMTGQLFRVKIGDEGTLDGIEEVKLSRALNVPDGIRFIDTDTLGVIEAGPGQYSTVSLRDGVVSVVATDLPGPATFASARGKAWVTSAQGGQFWTADGDCKNADHPFRLVETPLR